MPAAAESRLGGFHAAAIWRAVIESGSVGCVSMRLEKPPATPARFQARRREYAAEYDNTIRDLTGVDLRLGREFPVDPAERGRIRRQSSGRIAGDVAGPRRKIPGGGPASRRSSCARIDPVSRSRPFPVVTETDRDKYCVQLHRRLLPAAPASTTPTTFWRPGGSGIGKNWESFDQRLCATSRMSAKSERDTWPGSGMQPNDPAAARTARWARSRRCGESYLLVFPSLLATRHRSRSTRLQTNPRPGSALRKTHRGASEQGVCQGHFRRQPAAGTVVEPIGSPACGCARAVTPIRPT